MTLIGSLHGSTFAGGAVTTLARIETIDGDPIGPEEISGLTYRIDRLDPCGSNPPTAVEGHEDRAVPPGDVLFDVLQQTGAWSVDTLGYNFRHDVDIADFPAFPDGGRSYSLRYALTPHSGPVIVFRFQIEAI